MNLLLLVLGLLLLTVTILTVAIDSNTDNNNIKPKYSPNWSSLDTRPIPEWYQNAKFGIFIHWGVFSVPSWATVGEYAEWYWYNLYNNPATTEHHNHTYGANFKYQDFAPLFKAELFNATEWAELISNSGARYVIPTSKHHEGFTLYPSTVSWNWNSVDIGPHRDIIGELFKAFKSLPGPNQIHTGLYYSLFEWYNPLYLTNPIDYVNEIMYTQWLELINNYQPDILWCDGDWMHNSSFWRAEEFIAWLYNTSPVANSIVINDRFGSNVRQQHGGFYTPEYNSTVWLDHYWEENSGIDIHSYGLNRNTPADKYWNTTVLLNLLVRCISNNGNLLLNIGPAADGTIPTIMQERLNDIGDWLRLNGESVYNTRIYQLAQYEGNNLDTTTIRYTASIDQSILYVFILQYPIDNILILQKARLLPNNVSTIELIGYTGGELYYTIDYESMTTTIQLPPLYSDRLTVPNQSNIIWVLKISNVQSSAIISTV